MSTSPHAFRYAAGPDAAAVRSLGALRLGEQELLI
jgi:hypothetical protein